MKITQAQLKEEILKLNGNTFASFKARYDIPTSILKKGSKGAQADLLANGIDRSKMFRRVTTTCQINTSKNGYNEFVQNAFDKAGLASEFLVWKAEQEKRYGETFNGDYERNDEENCALQIGKNDTQHLVVFRTKNTETHYYYINELTGEECEIQLDDKRLVDFQPKRSEKYAKYTDVEKAIRLVRDSVSIKKPKLENITSIKFAGHEFEISKDMADYAKELV